MAIDNPDILQRLQLARTPREKKVPQPIARVSEKKKAKDAEDKKAGIKPEPRKPIAKRSEKMKGIMAAIKPLYKSFLKSHPVCEIRSPNCIGNATCVHHTAGRGMNHLMNMESWQAACDPCNHWVESNDDKAKEKGSKKSRHLKADNL